MTGSSPLQSLLAKILLDWIEAGLGIPLFPSVRLEDGFLFQLPSTHAPKNLCVFGPAFELLLNSDSTSELNTSQQGPLSLESSVEVFAQDASWEFRKRMHSWHAIRRQVLLGLISTTSPTTSHKQSPRPNGKLYPPQFDTDQKFGNDQIGEFTIEKLAVETIDDYLSVQNNAAQITDAALPTGLNGAAQQRAAIQNRLNKSNLNKSNIEQYLVRQGHHLTGAFATHWHAQSLPSNKGLNAANLHQERPTDVLALFDLCVHPDFQGQSIGRHIVHRLMRKAIEQEFAIAVFATQDLAPYYQKLGFESSLCLQRWSNIV